MPPDLVGHSDLHSRKIRHGKKFFLAEKYGPSRGRYRAVKSSGPNGMPERQERKIKAKFVWIFSLDAATFTWITPRSRVKGASGRTDASIPGHLIEHSVNVYTEWKKRAPINQSSQRDYEGLQWKTTLDWLIMQISGENCPTGIIPK